MTTTASQTFGEACTPTANFNVTYYADTCNSQMLSCDANSQTCQWRSCTILGITPGWNNATHSPPTPCGSGTFCPNSQLRCLPVLSTGSSCEKGRDDECAGSEAICLNSVCSRKSASVNSICGTEMLSDGYSAVGVVRDNCTSGTFCSALNGIGVCQDALVGGATCLQNRQCLSQQCNNDICEAPAASADSLPAWKWAIIGVIIALCLISFAFVTYTVLRKKRTHGLGVLRYDDPTHKPRRSPWPLRWASRWTFWNRRNTTTDYNLDEPEKPVVQNWNHSNITETYDTVAITPTPSVFPLPPRRSPAPWKQNKHFASRAVDHVNIRLSGTFTPTFGNGHRKPTSPAVDAITSPANAYSVMSEEDEMRMWQAIRGDTPPWPVQGKGWKFARGTRSP